MSGFSAGANCFLNSPNLIRTIGPNPTTVRGASVPVNYHPKENRIIYPSGKFVVVRSLDDPNDCFIYRGHAFPVTVAKFAPNGYWVASADNSGKVRVWSWDNPEHLMKLETGVFAGSVLDLDWDSESKKICAVGEGSGIMAKVFTWDTGNSAGEMVGHTKRILSVAFKHTRPFRLVTASEDMRTIFYAGPPFKLDHSNNTVHTNFVNCVRYAPDGSRIVSVGSDKKIQVYNGANGEPVSDIVDAHAGGIYSVSFSPDSTKFATASADKTIKIWDAATNNLDLTLHVSPDPQLGDMQVSVLWLRGNQVLSVSLNGNINIFDLSLGEAPPARVIVAHQVAITAMTLDSVSNRLYTGSYDGVVCVRDLATAAHTTKVAGNDKRSMCGAAHNGKVTGLALAGEDTVVSIGWDDTMRFANAQTQTYTPDAIGLTGQPVALATSPMAPGLLVVATNQEVSLYRHNTLLSTLRNPGYTPLCAALFGADEVAVGGDDNKTHIYTIHPGNFELSASGLVETRSPVTSLAYNPLGDTLAIGDTGRQVEVYERGTWTPRIQGRWVFHTSKITALSWSPSGAILASGSLDESIILWNLGTQDKMAQFQFAHMGGVSGLAWVNEGELVSTGNDQVVAQWRV